MPVANGACVGELGLSSELALGLAHRIVGAPDLVPGLYVRYVRHEARASPALAVRRGYIGGWMSAFGLCLAAGRGWGRASQKPLLTPSE
jgi:hypothetical protein